MIELARGQGIRNARFQVMDIEQLSFPDASFEAAACGHGLQFVPDLSRALGEAHRVLRRGSRFAASVPLSNDNQRPWMVIDEVVDRWLPPRRPQPTSRQLAPRSPIPKHFAMSHRAQVLPRPAWRRSKRLCGGESAEQLVGLCMSWWDWPRGVERLAADRRQAFMDDAIASLRRDHPGVIETIGRNHVLFATALTRNLGRALLLVLVLSGCGPGGQAAIVALTFDGFGG